MSLNWLAAEHSQVENPWPHCEPFCSRKPLQTCICGTRFWPKQFCDRTTVSRMHALRAWSGHHTSIIKIRSAAFLRRLALIISKLYGNCAFRDGSSGIVRTCFIYRKFTRDIFTDRRILGERPCFEFSDLGATALSGNLESILGSMNRKLVRSSTELRLQVNHSPAE